MNSNDQVDERRQLIPLIRAIARKKAEIVIEEHTNDFEYEEKPANTEEI